MFKTALVTGSSTGIGHEIVKALRSSGVKVIAIYNSSNPTYRYEDVIYRKLDITDNVECKLFLGKVRISHQT